MENRTGRLIEARVFRLRSRADADDYSNALGLQVAAIPKEIGPVLVADHRPVVIYAQPVADRLAELFVDMNARLERVAIVVARSNATLVFQLDRLVRQAAFVKRRLCYEVVEAHQHLEPVLTAVERERARTFLDEYRSA
jgi:hypothetical protein